MRKFIIMGGTLSTAHKWYIFKCPLREEGPIALKISPKMGNKKNLNI